MDNKKYLDKVVGSLVRGTRLYYDREEIHFPFSPFPFFSHLSHFHSHSFSLFSTYCKNQFGLTEDEIGYVWKEYVDIITDKLEDGE